MKDLNIISVSVLTADDKLHLITNKLQTHLESGDPHRLYLLTPSPNTYTCLPTRLPPTPIFFDASQRNVDCAIIICTYRELHAAIEARAIEEEEIGILVCDKTHQGGKDAQWLLDRLKSPKRQIIEISVSKTPTAPNLTTTIAYLYPHTSIYPQTYSQSDHKDYPLDKRSAIPALTKFLSTLPDKPVPLFTVTPTPPYHATLHLPNTIPLGGRTVRSSLAHKTIADACADAALEAICDPDQGLSSLLDDKGNPLFRRGGPKLKKQQPQVPVTMDPWAGVLCWERADVYSTLIHLNIVPGEEIVTAMLTPIPIPPSEEITVYWDRTTTGSIRIGECKSLGAQPGMVRKAQKITNVLLRTVHGPRMDAAAMAAGTKNMAYLFLPHGWNETHTTASPVNALNLHKRLPGEALQVLRDTATRYGGVYLFRRWLPGGHLDLATDPRYTGVAASIKFPSQPVLEAVKFLDRRDFLHPVAGDAPAPPTVHLLPEFTAAEPVPYKFWKLTLLIPGIVNRVSISLIARNLQESLLGHVSMGGITAAILAPGARESMDYQRLEFLGDLAVKYLITLEELIEHPSWHEQYLETDLSEKVSNVALAKMSELSHLGHWIVTDVFTGSKWHPRYLDTAKAAAQVWHPTSRCPPTGQEPLQPKTRQLPGKVLADVFEALVGASYIDGGVEGASSTLRALNQGMQVARPVAVSIQTLIDYAKKHQQPYIPYLDGLGTLLKYRFNQHSILLEALTHRAHAHSRARNCGRLMILGGAVLDLIVGERLYRNANSLDPVDMTLYKSAVLSGNMLTYLSIGWLDGQFWRYVYVPQPALSEALGSLQRQSRGELGETIRAALDHEAHYPWAPLSVFEADTSGKNKHLADTINALVGAVYLDSSGSLTTVQALIESLGIFKVLCRLLKDNVDVLHPVTRLQQKVASLGKGQLKYEWGLAYADNNHVCTIKSDAVVLALAHSPCKAEATVLAAMEALAKLEMAEKGIMAPEDEGWD